MEQGYKITKEVLKIIATSGGIARVSEDTLRANGAHKLYSEEEGVYRVLMESDLQRLSRRCESLLSKYHGYIFADDHQEATSLVVGTGFISESRLDAAEARAERFIAAGIPPIFDPALNLGNYYSTPESGPSGHRHIRTTYRFPSVDFVILYGSGMWERVCAAISIERRNQGFRDRIIRVPPVSTNHVLIFRAQAFASASQLDAHLAEEMHDYISTYFQFGTDESRQHVLEQYRAVVAHLEQALAAMSYTRRLVQRWDGNVALVHERRWYLTQALSERSRIARAYLDSLPGPPTGKDKETVRRLGVLFPHSVQLIESEFPLRKQEQEIIAIDDSVTCAMTSGDYCNIPQTAWENSPWQELVIPAAEQAFRVACIDLGQRNPDKLMGNVEDVFRSLPFPSWLPKTAAFKKVLDEVRLSCAQSMNDQQFLAIYGGPTGHNKCNSIGHAKNHDEAAESKTLRSYLIDRLRALRTAPPPPPPVTQPSPTTP